MELPAGSRAWAYHRVVNTRGATVSAADVKASAAVVPRGAAPLMADWETAEVVDHRGGVEVAVWCDVTDATPGEIFDIHVDFRPGDERLPYKTGILRVT